MSEQSIVNKNGKDDLIVVENLVKYFPVRGGLMQRVVAWVQAVDDISFTVRKGETLGLVGESQSAHPRPGWVMAWDKLTAEQQAARARDMEIYAAMIDYMDERIGRVLKHLRKSGVYDNTLVVFTAEMALAASSTLLAAPMPVAAARFTAPAVTRALPSMAVPAILRRLDRSAGSDS